MFGKKKIMMEQPEGLPVDVQEYVDMSYEKLLNGLGLISALSSEDRFLISLIYSNFALIKLLGMEKQNQEKDLYDIKMLMAEIINNIEELRKETKNSA